MIGHIKSGQYLKNIARAILKEYCPPHKARGIHDFILATKSSVWIIMCFYVQTGTKQSLWVIFCLYDNKVFYKK